ncbi:hypothetical protein HMI54_009565, partial [Coelomomyces lativittatus]
HFHLDPKFNFRCILSLPRNSIHSIYCSLCKKNFTLFLFLFSFFFFLKSILPSRPSSIFNLYIYIFKFHCKGSHLHTRNTFSLSLFFKYFVFISFFFFLLTF